MGSLIAFGFDRSWAANEALKRLRTETALADAFIVERAELGRCAIRRASCAASPEAAPAADLWGAMVRQTFLNSNLDREVPRGGSALFVLLEDAAEARILRAVKPYRARILKTSLPREAEQRLKEEFATAA